MATTEDLQEVQDNISLDILDIPEANLLSFYNFIIGTQNNDFLYTTFLNDIVIALGGDDRIFGGFGSDIFVGGTGFDTADYSYLGQAITLEAGGFVNKGFLGTDRLLEMESVVGAVGQANVIDGSTGTSTTTSLNVNLAQSSLIVNGVPGLGTLKFNVQNFVNVIGTEQGDIIFGDNNNNFLDGRGGNDTVFGLGGNDTVKGGSGNDVIGGGNKSNILSSSLIFSDGNDFVDGGSGNDVLIGGTGFDILDGGTGFDTADYSHLGQAITLEAVGVVNKGFFRDQILNTEKIIGATGKANAIDGSTGTSTTTSFDVNLAQESLIVNGIPGLGSANFQVQNFVNVTGTSQADSIIGNNKNNILGGGKGNDSLSGLGGKDTLIGVDPTNVKPGLFEIDILTGGSNADNFVVGDEKNPYYVGGGGFFGLNDFAFITDFQTGEDRIQLNQSQNYIFGQNFIAVSNFLIAEPVPYEQASGDLLTTGGASEISTVDVDIDSTVNDIISNNGAYYGSSVDAETSLKSSPLIPFPSFDIVAIVADNYSVADIDFV